MALKNYFAKNKNNVVLKKMADLLCISQESLHAQEDKMFHLFDIESSSSMCQTRSLRPSRRRRMKMRSMVRRVIYRWAFRRRCEELAFLENWE